MSEIATVGIATGAVGACALVAGAVAGAGYLTYRALDWISAQAQREMERLERELHIPMPTHVTTKEAREAFEKHLLAIKTRVSKNPALKQYGDAVAGILALKQSPLALFVNEAEWRKLGAVTPSQNFFKTVVKQASRRFTQANAKYVTQSIMGVARQSGFTHQSINHSNNGKKFLVMNDNLGRAVVAEINESDNGAKINLDLTGFGDGSCHQVMDRILNGLAEKDIRLEGIHRHSHYRREGILLSNLEYPRKQEKVNVIPNDQEHQKDMIQRRQHYHGIHRGKIKS